MIFRRKRNSSWYLGNNDKKLFQIVIYKKLLQSSKNFFTLLWLLDSDNDIVGISDNDNDNDSSSDSNS